MANYAALVDIDGTLVDSNYQHTLAWWRAFRAAGITVPTAKLHKLIGMGSDQLLEELIGRQDEGLEKASGEQFQAMRHEVTAFPGATQLLRELSTRGFAVVLATSGRPNDVAHMRSLLKADDWITAEVNSSEISASKPAPDIFALALERSGADAAHAVVIGDTGWDIDAATRCDLPCIGVTTGGWSRRDLDARGAIEVYEDVEELTEQMDAGIISRLAKDSTSAGW